MSYGGKGVAMLPATKGVCLMVERVWLCCLLPSGCVLWLERCAACYQGVSLIGVKVWLCTLLPATKGGVSSGWKGVAM